MLKSKGISQNEYEFISIDELVPESRLLRLIDKYIDLSFILEKTQSYYSEDNGRTTDPLILFKMLFIGYIYGICAERKLEQEIKMNASYRWFLGLKFSDPVPHHSTISRNCQYRFKERISSKKFPMKLFFKQ